MTRLSLRRLWGSGLGKRLLNTRFDQAMPLFVVGCIFIMLTVAWVQTWEHPLGETSASAPHSDLRELTHVWKAVREWREQNAAVGTSGGDDVTTTGNALAIPRLFHQSWKNKYPPRVGRA